MCTAITFHRDHFYFGRNLDWENDCRGRIVVCPRRYPFLFRNAEQLLSHYAMIGVAAVAEGYPLYFDAVNECGVGMAGLNFPHYALYHDSDATKNNLAPFELIPWLLGKCAGLKEVKAELESINIWDIPFSDSLPLSPLHWLIADKTGCCVLESTQEGIQVYDDPYGILTNSPPFPYHSTHIAEYLNLTTKAPENRFSKELQIEPFSFGMGAIGLPGDPSSASRFIRAAFTRCNSPQISSEQEALAHYFHLLRSVEQQKGLTEFPGGGHEFTVYSSCCDTDAGIYYYTTYDSHSIHCVDMHRCDLNAAELFQFPLLHSLTVCKQN